MTSKADKKTVVWIRILYCLQDIFTIIIEHHYEATETLLRDIFLRVMRF